MTAMLHIGVSRETVQAARAAILDIIKATKDRDAVAVEALETLRSVCNVSGTTVQNCQFTGKP